MYTYSIPTDIQGYYDITQSVMDAVKDSGVKSGLCVIFVPHTTAGVTINENADRDVVGDMINGMNSVFPNRVDYMHQEKNSDAHLKSSNIGCSITVIVDAGKLVLGLWQGIYFAEFDGPRNRNYYVKVIAD